MLVLGAHPWPRDGRTIAQLGEGRLGNRLHDRLRRVDGRDERVLAERRCQRFEFIRGTGVLIQGDAVGRKSDESEEKPARRLKGGDLSRRS